MPNNRMDITIDNVTPYLLHQGLLNTISIVDNDLKIIDVSKRNRNLKVIREHDQSYLLKQSNLADGDSREAIQREASIYALIHENSEFKSLRQIIPRFIMFDGELDLLVTELITNGKTLGEYMNDSPRRGFADVLAASLGDVMANYHRIFAVRSRIFDLSFLPMAIPPTFSICHPGPDALAELSPANLELLKSIQHYPELPNHFKSLVNSWRVRTLIHGDIRWDNILLLLSNDHGESLQIKLIDWEYADIGDPAWDIGSVFQDFFTFWLYSLRITGIESIEQLLINTDCRCATFNRP